VNRSIAKKAAGKVVPPQRSGPQRLKPDQKETAYRSAEALAPPKINSNQILVLV